MFSRTTDLLTALGAAAGALVATLGAIQGCASSTCADTGTCGTPAGAVCQVASNGQTVCTSLDGSADGAVDGTVGDGPGADGGEGGAAICDPDSAGALVCSGTCVEATNPEHCGSCDNACPGPASAHGAATCTAPSTCGVTCNAGYHVCNGDCLSNTDVPATSGDPCVISESFGVFVAPPAAGGSDATGSGSRAAPYATLGHALANLGSTARVYVCNGSFPEAVTVSSAVSILGGLACPGGSATAWSYVSGGKAASGGPANEPALAITNVSGAVDLEDLSFTAASASGQDSLGNGASSIAALVSGSTVSFHRCAFTAGQGASGVTPGAPAANYTAAAAPSGSSNSGLSGGAGGSVQCTDQSSSQGGSGGDGAADGGTGGGDGGATPAVFESGQIAAEYDGLGGSGGTGRCTPGDMGSNGAAGLPASAASTVGGFSTSTPPAWVPSTGSPGSDGNPGGGGGGGGGKSTVGGTGGGAGGCGGAGGLGGGGGGGSIALACVSSSVTLDACTMTTSVGGNGSAGGDGEAGQQGGPDGVIVTGSPCTGDYGGNGAGGAGGAGGTAGISVCVLYQGTEPSGAPSCTLGSAGSVATALSPGGAGGDNGLGNPGVAGPTGVAGLSGLAQPALQVP